MHQIPSTDSQIMIEISTTHSPKYYAAGKLEFEYWTLFGIWDLLFAI
jgi:hypothetical protein